MLSIPIRPIAKWPNKETANPRRSQFKCGYKNTLQLLDAELDWLLLTKRPENVLKYGPLGMRWTQDGMPKNVWIGTTVENQEWADKRIPELLKIPAAVRFLSVEPLLGPIDFYKTSDVWPPDQNHPWRNEPILHGIHWLICGGESGSKARPMHPYWARALRDQCKEAGVPFFFKQWGEWAEVEKEVPNRIASPRMVQHGDAVITTDGRIALVDKNLGCRLEGQGFPMRKVGKKKAGRELDGRTWDEIPEVHP